MTRPAFEAFLRSLTVSERNVLRHLAGEPRSELLGSLLAAVAAEIRADVEREAAVVREIEAEHRAEVEKIAEGVTWPNGTPTWQEFSGTEGGGPRVEG